jgi:SAM-dependent methyltransferase
MGAEMTPQFVTDERRPHLGGYIAGGDPWTWCPSLWAWLIERYAVKSVIDVGCGEGHALRWFRERGCRVHGIDGITQDDPDIEANDYTIGPSDSFFTSRDDFDLCWCCEFVEHVEERHMPNYLPSLEQGRVIAMTHAEPGQPGWHHVNNQPAAYWKGVLAAIGYRFDWEATIEGRGKAPSTHFARSGMIFRRA